MKASGIVRREKYPSEEATVPKTTTTVPKPSPKPAPRPAPKPVARPRGR